MNARNLSDVETPFLVVDRDRLISNLDRVQAIADARGVRLRPHVKTHKCLEVARLQMERGAEGLTASKVDEALTFFESGMKSVTVAYPVVDERKLRRLLVNAQKHHLEVRTIVDSAHGVAVLEAAANASAVLLGVFLKIDVGLYRCGVREDDPRLRDVLRSLVAAPSLRFVGLLSHAGHAYAATNREGVAAIATEECAILQRIRCRIENEGIEVGEISVGSTPTVLASESYDGITEIRPGNYAFLDATAVRLGLATLDQVALTVAATIVSANDRYFIIDAGSKVLSSDLGAHGTGAGDSYGMAFPLGSERETAAALNVVRLSEEHGFVGRGDSQLAVGSKLRIVPNHACPVVNLAEQLMIVSGEEIVGEWKVAARGCVR